MGRSRYQIHDPKAPYFLTCTILNWMPLFTRPSTVNIILDALTYRQRERGWKVYGYVILENHLHMIAQAENLKKELSSFKSWTARQLIDHLHEQQAERLLKQLSLFRRNHKKDREYQLWEEGSHPQIMENAEILRQKLEYIHRNPVKRGYVDEAEHWRYSSARNYAGGEGLMPVFTAWY